MAKKTTKKIKNTRSAAPKKKPAAPKVSAAKPAVAQPKSQKTSPRPKKKPEPPLTADELKRFQKLLLEKLHEITGDVNHIEDEALKKSRTDATGDLSTMPIHMADIGSDNFEQEFALDLMNSERKIVSEIIAAMKRIENGSYGICEGTGNPIPRARLEASPWARYCIEYAVQIEKGQAAAKYNPVRDNLDFPMGDGDYSDETEGDDDHDKIDEDIEYDMEKIEDDKRDTDRPDDEKPVVPEYEDDGGKKD